MMWCLGKGRKKIGLLLKEMKPLGRVRELGLIAKVEASPLTLSLLIIGFSQNYHELDLRIQCSSPHSVALPHQHDTRLSRKVFPIRIRDPLQPPAPSQYP